MGIIQSILIGVEFVGTLVLSIIAWFLKKELNKVDAVYKDLNKFKTRVAEEYVRKDDYNRANSEIMHRLDVIQEMLVAAITNN